MPPSFPSARRASSARPSSLIERGVSFAVARGAETLATLGFTLWAARRVGPRRAQVPSPPVCESCASGAPARRARSTALLCEHAALLLCGRLRCGEVVVRCGLVCQVFEGSRCGAGLVVRSGRSCALSSASRSVVRWFACCTGLLAPKRGALRFRSGEERPALNLTQLSDFNSSLSSPWSRSLHAPTP